MAAVSQDLAFKIPYRFHPYVQDAVIEEAIASGYVSDAQPFWIKHDVRSLVSESVDGTWTEKQPGDFFYRMDPRAEWFWEDNETAKMLKPTISQVQHLFTKMTRVKVFVQKPDMEIAAHRDLIAGNKYRFIKGPTKPSPGAYSGVYQGHPSLIVEDNTRHSDQKYLALKIPVSADPVSGGRAYVIGDGKKKYLRAADYLYFLNEYEFHGCDPVDFHRGVVFVDGILNMEALGKERKIGFE